MCTVMKLLKQVWSGQKTFWKHSG